jgi:hypothetical protein
MGDTDDVLRLACRAYLELHDHDKHQEKKVCDFLRNSQPELLCVLAGFHAGHAVSAESCVSSPSADAKVLVEAVCT